MSLYKLDESTRQLLKLENFNSVDFSIKTFLEKLSSSQSYASGNEVLDPKPFIRTFEAAASELQRLSEVAKHQEDSSSSAATQLRESHNLNIIDMAANVDQCVLDVQELDEQVSELIRGTAYMGDKLERVSRMHSQVVTIKQLVEYYLSFVRRGSSPELMRLFQSQSASDRRRCAQAVGQLQLLARKVGKLPQTPTVEEDIDKFAEHMETHFINVFQDAYTSFDLVGMREIAQILHSFNNSAAVVQAFVNQHDFFMQVDKVDDNSALLNETLWTDLSTLESEYPEFESEVQNLVDEVMETVIQETKVIRKIFPQPVQVLTVFMQRIFAQRMQGQIMVYIEEAESRSPLAHVRVLYTCYHRIQLMAKTLKDFWTRGGVDKDGELSLMLDSNVNDIFVMFIDKYFDVELKALANITSGPSTSIESSDRYASPAPCPGTPGAAGNNNSNTNYNSPASPSSQSQPQTPTQASSTTTGFMRAVRLERTPTVRQAPVPQLEISHVQRILSAFAEAVGREQVLSPPAKAEYDAIELFNLLAKDVGGNYINTALDDALQRAQLQDTKQDVSWTYIDTIRKASNCVQLLNVFVRTVLLAMVRSSEQTQQRMAEKLEQYIASCQDTCNAILEAAIQQASTRTRFYLGRQKRKEFTPKEPVGGLSLASKDIYTMLRQLGTQAQASLTGSNLHSFLAKIGSDLYSALHNNLKKLTFNQLGGKILAYDLQCFEKLIVDEWKVTEVAESFAMLRALARLYTVESSALPSLLRDSHFARLKSHALREYVSLRTDHNQYDIQRLFLSYL